MSTPESPSLPRARTTGVVVQETGDELLVYDLSNDRCTCLEGSAKQIWHLADGTRSANEIRQTVGLAAGDGDAVVEIVLEQLRAAGLLDFKGADAGRFFGLSRREMLKRAGMVGLVPLVSSLVMPTPAAAASTCVDLAAPCTIGGMACCGSAVCVNTEAPPTGFACVTCTPLGQACTPGLSICCSGSCLNTEGGTTGFQCVSTV